MTARHATLPQRMRKIMELARRLAPIPMAVVDAGEEHVLAGAHEAAQAGLIAPTLIGRRKEIKRVAQKLGIAPGGYPIVETDAEQASAEAGVRQVLEGRAAGLMKGWIHTDALMHPVLRHLRTSCRVSHVFVVELASYHKLLLVTDAAINISPDLATKAAIVQNAVDLARLLGISRPKVAALSAVEVVKPAIASTIDAACLSKMAQRGQIHHAVVDGPLAFDNAISKDAALTKHIDSEVSGDVDILLAPDLNAGNILAKDLEYLAGATMAGIVIGARVPIVLPSRSDPPLARLVSAAIAVLVHHRWHTGAASSSDHQQG
ncbi:MAG TPA: bifunctional enoyl-CoA hydratase/phosphate acetyltransferase [Gammaproteobacteria bacterium]|nr:bifunctional enoyl-CoA hydratase/phosphate acetyltransferase [Gammaproteobacteria bacterium]